MRSWRISTTPLNGSTYMLVHAPYNEEFVLAAKHLGGRWCSPIVSSKSWQWKLPAEAGRQSQAIEDMEQVLQRYYPENTESENVTISLDRDTVPISTGPTRVELPHPVSQNGATLTQDELVRKIARTVTAVVSPIIDQKLQNSVTVFDRKTANIERDLNTAILDSQTAVRNVNKRLDEVMRPLQVTIIRREQPETHIEIANYHRKFPQLLELCKLLSPERRNIWLAGPTGSGKTTAGRQLAEALGLPFFFNGAIDTQYKLEGFIDAQGRIVSTAFRKACEAEDGAVYMFDECDRSMSGALLAFNAHLGNGLMAFPDKVIPRPPNLIALATGNTWGFGGDTNYVGAAKLDYAFLNRFSVKIKWDYDEAQELRIATSIGSAIAGERGAFIAKKWWDVAIETRKLMVQHKATMIISPRIVYAGTELLAGGMKPADVVELTYGEYMSHDKWSVVGVYANNFAVGL